VEILRSVVLSQSRVWRLVTYGGSPATDGSGNVRVSNELAGVSHVARRVEKTARRKIHRLSGWVASTNVTLRYARKINELRKRKTSIYCALKIETPLADG
jgi:hypothetical protein